MTEKSYKTAADRSRKVSLSAQYESKIKIHKNDEPNVNARLKTAYSVYCLAPE